MKKKVCQICCLVLLLGKKMLSLHFTRCLKKLASCDFIFWGITLLPYCSFSTWQCPGVFWVFSTLCQRSNRDRWHSKSTWSICCAWILNSLCRIWVCSNSTALNLCHSSCGTVFWLGCFSSPPLKQCFKILLAIVPFVLHAGRRIFRGLLTTHCFMEHWMVFSLPEGYFSLRFNFCDSFLQGIWALQ